MYLKLAIGSDHRGFQVKEEIKKYLEERGIEYEDFGTFSDEATDYPDIGAKVAREVSNGHLERGILICETGLGMTLVANKFRGIRATLCHDLESTKQAREHLNSNILTMGGKIVDRSLIPQILDIWLNTEFTGGRHTRRLGKISAIEKNIGMEER